jgi:multicomponent Na+:H+ antiporter subunit E
MGIEKAEIRSEKTPPGDAAQSPSAKSARKKRIAPILFTFIISLATWLILSGQFDPFHISLGIVSSFIVAYLSGDLLFQNPIQKGFMGRVIRFVIYIPWLMVQIFIANLHILKIVFHPKPMEIIDPKIVKFSSKLSGQMPLYILGNSITLTPGTVTIFVNVFGTYTVHAIDQQSAEALPGEMENKIARIFHEPEDS